MLLHIFGLFAKICFHWYAVSKPCFFAVYSGIRPFFKKDDGVLPFVLLITHRLSTKIHSLTHCSCPLTLGYPQPKHRLAAIVKNTSP